MLRLTQPKLCWGSSVLAFWFIKRNALAAWLWLPLPCWVHLVCQDRNRRVHALMGNTAPSCSVLSVIPAYGSCALATTEAPQPWISMRGVLKLLLLMSWSGAARSPAEDGSWTKALLVLLAGQSFARFFFEHCAAWLFGLPQSLLSEQKSWMSPLRFGNNRGAKQKHGSNFGVRALVAKHCGRKGAFLGTAARSFGVLLAAVLDGARLLCSCAWSEADYDSGANFALSMWRGDAAGAHLPSTQEYIVPINVPEPDVAVPLVALAGLIVMMTTDTPENLTQCPLCEVQAGFHASHCWAYGPVVVFHLVRKHARSARVALDRSLSLDGRSYKLRACVCATEAKPILVNICCLCSASCDASMGAVIQWRRRPAPIAQAAWMKRIVRTPYMKSSCLTLTWRGCPLLSVNLLLELMRRL